MAISRLIGIDGNEDSYSLAVFNIQEDKWERIITIFSFENLKDELKNIFDCKTDAIIFNNQLMTLSLYLKEYYIKFLVSSNSLLNHKVYGIFPCKRISEYGYNINAVKTVEHSTNLVNYIIMKNKSL